MNKVRTLADWPKGEYGWRLDMIGDMYFEVRDNEVFFYNYSEGKAEGGEVTVPIQYTEKDAFLAITGMCGPHGASDMTPDWREGENLFDALMEFFGKYWSYPKDLYCGNAKTINELFNKNWDKEWYKEPRYKGGNGMDAINHIQDVYGKSDGYHFFSLDKWSMHVDKDPFPEGLYGWNFLEGSANFMVEVKKDYVVFGWQRDDNDNDVPWYRTCIPFEDKERGALHHTATAMLADMFRIPETDNVLVETRMRRITFKCLMRFIANMWADGVEHRLGGIDLNVYQHNTVPDSPIYKKYKSGDVIDMDLVMSSNSGYLDTANLEKWVRYVPECTYDEDAI